jgi:hypothetical protein
LIVLCGWVQGREGDFSNLARLFLYANQSMDATPINLETAIPLEAGMPAGALDFADVTALKWTALHDAAAVVAALAGIPQQPLAAELHDFAGAVASAPHYRRELAAQGVEDLTAIMQPGIAALIAVRSRGGDATAPAVALWQEFTASRDALLAMVLPRD